ncbi:MAG: nucleoside deaminase [Balneolales bacterium]|nr:nucleoside deaminase [Balneolales bacterium]
MPESHPFASQMRRLIDAAIVAGTPYASMLLDAEGNEIALTPNRVKQEQDPTSHAEMNTIREASARLGSADLSGCHLITTCEPCPMCAAAIFWSGISKVTFGLSIEGITAAGHRQIPLKAAALLKHSRNPVEIEGGLLAEEVRKLFPKKAL